MGFAESYVTNCFNLWDSMLYRNLLASVILASQIGCSSESGVRTPLADVGEANDGAALDAMLDLEIQAPITLRVATFNASMFRAQAGALLSDLKQDDTQAKAVAAVLQRVRPDIVLINEFDWDADAEGAKLFAENYLSVAQSGSEPLEYLHIFVPPTNTGISSGVDLNNDGKVEALPGSQAYGDDSFGFGRFSGQYGFVVLSRYPIVTQDIRTFQNLLWKDMPGNLLPLDWYTPASAEVFRLSSKNHVDVPVDVNGKRIHILASHPTPPSFDGPEDRNGKRNHDEIRFWSDYIGATSTNDYIVDDLGTRAPLAMEASFVILGDLNSDPIDGDSIHSGITGLLENPRTQDTRPQSLGAAEAAQNDGQANTSHTGDAKLDTANFSDGQVGNLRVDFVIPAADLTISDSGVFWPAAGTADESLADTSDHHLVWIDIEL